MHGEGQRGVVGQEGEAGVWQCTGVEWSGLN